MRPKDEIWINRELFEGMFAEGAVLHARVTSGPTREARIVGVMYDPFTDMIRVKYDREVEEPTLASVPEGDLGYSLKGVPV